jgi:hypothetical protein
VIFVGQGILIFRYFLLAEQAPVLFFIKRCFFASEKSFIPRFNIY